MATGHSTLYFYILLASLKTFGITKFALRFPAAIFGILSVTVFYLIMVKVFNQLNNSFMKNLFPLLTACLFLTSHWFINFTRFSFEVTFLLFLELTSIYLFIKFDEIKKTKLANFYLIFSGLFAGLAFLSYIPGRIFFAFPAGLIFLRLFGQERKQVVKNLLLFLIPFVIVITPLTVYLSTHIDTRIDQEFFMNNHQVTIPVKIAGLWHNISTTALMFNVKGDVNGRQNYPNKPALNPLLGIFFLIGLGFSVWHWKKYENQIFLIYFLLSIFPALMTYPWENPSMLRTFTAIPSVIFFAAMALLELSRIISKKFPSSQKLIFTGIFLVVLFSAFYELRTYFKYQSTVFNQAFEIKLPLDKALKVTKKI